MAGRNYSRKDSPTLSDLPLIWDSANSDWRLTTIQAILTLFTSSSSFSEAPIVELEATLIGTNPIPSQGQLAIAADAGYFKIGDGVTAWNSLTDIYQSDDLVDPIIELEATLIATDPVAEAGQLVVASDAGYFKIGDGTTAWSALVGLYNTDPSKNDTAWTSVIVLDNAWTGTVSYIRRSGMVTVTGNIDGSAKTGDTVLSLPIGYRPAITIQGPVWDGTTTAAAATIGTSGNLDVAATHTATTFSFVFPVL